MSKMYFQQKELNPWFHAFERPVHDLMELNMKTLQGFSYFTPIELLKVRKPEEILEKNVDSFIENSHKTLDYMQQMFHIMEKHWLTMSDNVMQNTQKTISEAQKSARQDLTEAMTTGDRTLKTMATQLRSHKKPTRSAATKAKKASALKVQPKMAKSTSAAKKVTKSASSAAKKATKSASTVAKKATKRTSAVAKKATNSASAVAKKATKRTSVAKKAAKSTSALKKTTKRTSPTAKKVTKSASPVAKKATKRTSLAARKVTKVASSAKKATRSISPASRKVTKSTSPIAKKIAKRSSSAKKMTKSASPIVKMSKSRIGSSAARKANPVRKVTAKKR